MKNQYLTLLCTVLMAGCAATAKTDYSGEPQPANEPEIAAVSEGVAEAEPQQAAESSRLICKREKPIGSKRIKKTCYTREQLDEQARQTQDAMMRNQQRAGCVECGGGG